MALTTTQVSQLYVALFGRASEGEGNKNWVNHDKNMIDTAALMLDTDAAKNYFGEAGQTNNGFVKVIYENTLGFINEADIAAWAANLDNGMSRAELVTLLLEEALSSKYAGSAPQEQLLNRIEVSDYMANNVETVAAENVESTQFLSVAHPNGKLNVTDDKSTVSSAESAIDEMSGGAVIDGETFSLTEDDNTIIGTAKNDLIKATNKTYNDGDTIVDGSITDNDVLELTTTANISATPKVTNIENINITANKVGTFEFAADGITGAKNVNVTRDNNTGAVEITTLDSASVNAKAGVTNLTVGYDSNKVSEATIKGATGTVTVTGVDRGGVVVEGAKDKAISVTEKAGVSDSKATINSSGAVTVTNAVDLLTLNSNAEATTYDLSAIALATDGSLTLAGDKDITVKIADTAITGKKVLNKNSAKTTIELTSNGTVDLKDVENVSQVILGATGTSVLTVNSDQIVASKLDQTSVTLKNAVAGNKGTAIFKALDNGADSAVTVTTLAIDTTNKFAELQLDASDDKLTVSTALTANGAALVLTGDKDITLASVTGAKEISSTSTANITLTSTGHTTATIAQAIELGAGNDNLTVGTDAKYEADLGAGNDTLKFVTAAVKAGSTFNLGAGDDTLEIALAANAVEIDFGAGSNTIKATDATAADLTAATLKGNVSTIDLSIGVLKVTNEQFADFGSSISLKGSAAKVLTVDASGASKAQTIDLSTISATNTTNSTIAVKGSAFGDTIIGSVVADAITLGAAGKKDIVDVSKSVSLAMDSITTFKTTEDKLKFGGDAGTATNFTAIDINSATAAFDASVAITKAQTSVFNTSTAGKSNYAFIIDSTNTGTTTIGYLVVDIDGDKSADHVVELTGLTGGTTTAATTDFNYADIIA